ncbi:hypothetical protein GPJ59_35725, partial [Streptomyces bambusae]|nr:hypothetical protein [Streptomyces bambusae]
MTSEQQHTSPHPHHRRRRNWAVGSIAAAVLVAGGGTAYWASSAYGGSGSGSGAAADASAALRAPSAIGPSPSAPGIASGETDPSGGGVTHLSLIHHAGATMPRMVSECVVLLDQ